MIERSPLDEVDDLPLGWIAHEAAPLIAEILGLLSDPGAARELGLSPAALERAASLAAERGPEALVKRLPGEFAALQTLLIEALDRELPERDRREFTRAVSRLAEVFGAVQAAAMGRWSDSRAAAAGPGYDPVAPPSKPRPRPRSRSPRTSGWPASSPRSGRTGAPFAIAHFEVEGRRADLQGLWRGRGRPHGRRGRAGSSTASSRGRERAFTDRLRAAPRVLPA